MFQMGNANDVNEHAWVVQVTEQEVQPNGDIILRTKTLGSGLSIGKAIECLNGIAVERYI